ncbi:uncharacterized protein BDR25DRAFT_227320 [Lindgomyces ingoldianus]|uniref:Uncharacterized protein n=1 Tax=Lindgomyces ingoldianus TaxID=673940 RepID=A0ACB6QT76_9PLEO|nr:uncharacterized protein BDR25DRAFT_227320 [Lindgomyces ingoldianus]KAF2469720.1 hypothetical protein BDR25DRAFT_227320 [Lindgomyces ingoldianus]
MSPFNLPFPPTIFCTISFATFFAAIRLSRRGRLYLAPLLFGSAVFSVKNSTYLSWVFPGAPSYWNLFMCVWMHHAASVLYIEPFQLPLVSSKGKEAWILAYKIWNDPQRQLKWSTYLQKKNPEPTAYTKRFIFVLRRVVKVAICWLLQLRVIGPTVSTYFRLTAADFAPSYHPFVSRLLWPDSGPAITIREIQLRSLMSVYWIWLAFLLLDGANVLLSIFFVAVLRIDTPEEWPPLYGSPLRGSSIRGFWAKFWHRLAGPSCACSGRLITRRIMRLAPHSNYEKVVIAFWTFFVSGVFHAVADWQGGETVMPVGEMQFWLANFAAGAIEMLVVGAVGRRLRDGRLGQALRSNVLRKTIGFVWVFAFFFWVVPMWQYPKFYAAMRPARRVVIREPGFAPESFGESGSARTGNWSAPGIEFISLLD